VNDVSIALYLTASCPHSASARDYLSRRGLAFAEHDVAADPTALQRLIWLTGHTSVPAIVVGDQVLVGFDPDRLDEMLAER
jgi:glutaredoxin